MDYTESFRPKRVPFSGYRCLKGRDIRSGSLAKGKVTIISVFIRAFQNISNRPNEKRCSVSIPSICQRGTIFYGRYIKGSPFVSRMVYIKRLRVWTLELSQTGCHVWMIFGVNLYTLSLFNFNVVVIVIIITQFKKVELINKITRV